MISELQWLVESFNLDIHALTSDGSTCVHMAAMEGTFFPTCALE